MTVSAAEAADVVTSLQAGHLRYQCLISGWHRRFFTSPVSRPALGHTRPST